MPFPPAPDAYLLTAIVHDWPDDAAVAILRRCAEAASPDGRVFVIEKIGRDGETPGTEMDLRLLVWMAGQERTVEQLTTLGAAAGLRRRRGAPGRRHRPAGDDAGLMLRAALPTARPSR